MKKSIALLCTILSAFILISCGGGGNPGGGGGGIPGGDSLVNGKNVNLKTLSVTPGTLVFNAETINYSVEVAASVDSILVNATPVDETAVVTINGAAAPENIPLDYGQNIILIVVTSADNTAVKDYAIIVNRINNISHNANLQGLGVNNGALSPAFSANTLAYTTEVANSIDAIDITPVAASAASKIFIDGNPVASNAAYNGSLNAGMNIFTIVVTAEDNTTLKTYSLVVYRVAISGNANLASLSISAGGFSPGFNKDITSYTVEVAYSVSSITLTPLAESGAATVKVNGTAVVSGSASSSIDLNPGSNTIIVLVTAQDGTTRTYSITVNRIAASSNNNLSGLSLSAGILAPVFDSGVTSYTASVPYTTGSITVTPLFTGLNAVAKVNDAPVLSGTASGIVSLVEGANPISIVVTAENGATKTYTVTVTRLGLNANANLSGIVLSTGSLSPTFSENTTTYSVNLTDSVTSINITPTLAVGSSTMTVNGTSVTNGSPFLLNNLSFGENMVSIVVTAENGTTKTYSVNVFRGDSDPLAGNPDGYSIIPAEGQLENVDNPTTVVGNGTASSCTSAAFIAAVANGGIIKFNCGPNPVTINLTATAKIFNDKGPKIVIDGGGLITLSGNGAHRILYQNTCDENQVWTTAHCDNQDSPQLTVQNITFVDGNAKGLTESGGGAIFVRGGRFKIINSRFFRNVADETGADVGGGAVRVSSQYNNLPVYIVTSTFGGRSDLANSASNGGAISSIGVSFTIINSIMSYNRAIGVGGNPAEFGTPGGGSGGAIYNDGNTMTLRIFGTKIENNSVNAYGSGIFFISNDHTGNIVIADSVIRNNVGGSWYLLYPGISAHADTPIAVTDSIIE